MRNNGRVSFTFSDDTWSLFMGPRFARTEIIKISKYDKYNNTYTPLYYNFGTAKRNYRTYTLVVTSYNCMYNSKTGIDLVFCDSCILVILLFIPSSPSFPHLPFSASKPQMIDNQRREATLTPDFMPRWFEKRW
jgi:hypothetical protein